MDAVKYLKEKARMTGKCKNGCRECPFHEAKGSFAFCSEFANECPERAVEIVEKWAHDHPRKTRAQDFFEKHPNALKNEKGAPYPCVKQCGYTNICNPKISCNECWNTPIE